MKPKNPYKHLRDLVLKYKHSKPPTFTCFGHSCGHPPGGVYTGYTRVVPKVVNNHFLHANREQQTKESMVVDGTSCCVILECLVTSIACITMADNDMSFRQRAVIEFLVKEDIPAAEIHKRLQHAYGSVCMGASSVRRWVKHFKDENTSIQDQPRSGRPRTASTERNKERMDEIIQDDRRVTVDTVARTLGLGHMQYMR